MADYLDGAPDPRHVALAMLRHALESKGLSAGALPSFDEMNPRHRFSPGMLKVSAVQAEETDRGLALVSAAYLDEQLARLLGAYFVQGTAERLLAPDRPLGTFSARIEICFALQLISQRTKLALNTIRRIRNDFAHVSSRLNFSEDPIRARAMSLTGFGPALDTSSPRGRFTAAVAGLSGIIDRTIRACPGRGPLEDPEIPVEVRDYYEQVTQEYKRLRDELASAKDDWHAAVKMILEREASATPDGSTANANCEPKIRPPK